MPYWKQIIGFPEYEIDTLGRVWSWYRLKYLKSSTTNGYHQLSLCNGCKTYTKRVHILVLENFIGKKPYGYEARHLDGNKDNNKLSNLKWGTKKENGEDRVRHGRSKGIKVNQGELHGMSKLTERDVRMIVYMYKTGLFTQQEIANVYNICQVQVSYIINKKFWKHIWR